MAGYSHSYLSTIHRMPRIRYPTLPLDRAIPRILYLSLSCYTHQTIMAHAHGNPADLLPDHYKEQIKTWFAEDAPSFDYGKPCALNPKARKQLQIVADGHC